MSKKTILLVDDDERLRDLLKDYLSEKGFKVYTSQDVIEAKEILYFFIFDLIRNIKEMSITPVIMLTAMGEDINKIDGLKTGADDYVAKPFEPEELYLRINKLLNFYDSINKQQIIISFGDYTFNTTTLNLKKNEDMIYLTEGENDLMLKLISKRNNIVLREELADSEYDETELRKIDVRITRLRQKIEINPKQPQYIKTIRGKGYKIICNKL